jgi:CheY-like chemotaxis protein
MLKSLGYTPLLASDGQQGILQLQIHDDTIDAILMDQNMPIKDGLTATREIRAMEQAGLLGKVKGRRCIVAVTAVVSAESERLFEEAGADGFLPKPLSLKKLEEALEKYLKKDGENSGVRGGGGGGGGGAGGGAGE